MTGGTSGPLIPRPIFAFVWQMWAFFVTALRPSFRHTDPHPATITPYQQLLLRISGRVVVGNQSPMPLLLDPHPGKASVAGNRFAFVLPIHG